MMNTSNQLADGLGAVFDEVVGAAFGVGDGGGVDVDAEVAVEGGEDFGEGDGAAVCLAAEAVGGADDLTVGHAAAGEEGHGDAGPVVAPDLGTDDGGAAKLAPDEDGAVFVEAALVEVFNECGDALIKDGEVFALAGEDVISCSTMPVPLAVVDGDDACSGLNEAAGGEEALGDAGGAVAVDALDGVASAVACDEAGVFFGEVEGVGELGGGEDAHGLLGEEVHAFHAAAGVDIAAEVVDAGEEACAVGEAIVGDALEGEVATAGAGVAEGGAGGAEHAGAGLVVGAVGAFVAHADEGRDGGVVRALELADDAAKLGPAAGRGDAGGDVAGGDVAGVALGGIVPGLRADEGADDGEFVHHLGHAREELADFDAGDVGADGLVRPGDLAGGIGLEVKHVLVRRAADEVDEDDGFVGAANAGLGLEREELGQGEAHRAEAANFEEIAPRDAVAERAGVGCWGEDFEHGMKWWRAGGARVVWGEYVGVGRGLSGGAVERWSGGVATDCAAWRGE